MRVGGTLERPAVGALLRDWRRRRHVSQLELALDAGVSTRHLSYVETGRARPSAALVLRLAHRLGVPLRDQNGLLLAAGHAPVHAQRDLDAPELGPVREALERVLAGHEPYPAMVLDGHWGLVAANRSVAVLTAGVAEHLLAPPANVLRLSLHPEGLAPRIANLGAWRAHVLDLLAREALARGDLALAALREELAALPGEEDGETVDPGAAQVAVPLRLRHGDAELSLLSTRTTFGTAVDVTLAELAIEAFLPADAATTAALRDLA